MEVTAATAAVGTTFEAVPVIIPVALGDRLEVIATKPSAVGNGAVRPVVTIAFQR